MTIFQHHKDSYEEIREGKKQKNFNDVFLENNLFYRLNKVKKKKKKTKKEKKRGLDIVNCKITNKYD